MPHIKQIIKLLMQQYPNCQIERSGQRTLIFTPAGADASATRRLKVLWSCDHLLRDYTVPANLHPHLQYVGYWKFTPATISLVDYYILMPIDTAIAGTKILIMPAAKLAAILTATKGGSRFYWDVTHHNQSIASRPLSASDRLATVAGIEPVTPELDLNSYVNNWQQLAG